MPGPTLDDEEMEVHFNQMMDTPDSPPASPPHSPMYQGETDYAGVIASVQKVPRNLCVQFIVVPPVDPGPCALVCT